MDYLTYIKRVIGFAGPNLFSSIIIMLSMLVNTRILGSSNPDNLYWLALFMPLNYICLAIYQAFTVAIQNYISQNLEKTDSFWGYLTVNIFFAAVIFSLLIILTFFCFPFNSYLYHLIAKNNPVFENFIIKMLAINFIVCVQIILTSFFYSLGKTNISSLFSTGCSLLCCGTTYLFIHFFNDNLNSLPDAILCVYSLACIALLLLVNKQLATVYFQRPSSEFTRTILYKTHMIFLPIFLTYLTFFCSGLFYNTILISFGASTIAGFGTAYRLQSFLVLPCIAIGIAIGILVNQKHQLTNKHILIGFLLSFIVSSIIAFTIYFLRAPILELIIRDSHIQKPAVEYFHQIAWSYIVLGPTITLLSILELTGQTIKSFIINFSACVLQICSCEFFSHLYHNLILIFKSILWINIFISAVVFFWFFLQNHIGPLYDY